MPHILYNIKISTLGWPFHAMLISFFHILLHYPCSMYGGIIILKQIIVIWEMTCNNGPNKVINITVNNCQSLWCSPRSSNLHEHHDLDSFFAGSSLNEYTVVHSQFYLTFITIYHLLPEIIYSCVPIQFTRCRDFWCSFLQHTCDILLRSIFSEQFDRIQVEPFTHW